MRDAIIRELVDEVKKIVGEGRQVMTKLIIKNNGTVLQGISICVEGKSLLPTIYIDKFIRDIEREKVTVSEVAHKIFKMYEENRNPELEARISDLTNKKFILDHVEYQLVNAARNKERLLDVPSKKIVDLAALYRVVIGNDESGISSFVISNEVLEIAGISIDELDEAACRNTKNAGFLVKPLYEVMAELTGMPEGMADVIDDGPQTFVLTNYRNINGASILLFNEYLAELAKKVNDDFFILPSSIHELLAIPVSQADDVKQLRQIVRNVNYTEVAPDEILGYEVYFYNREKGEVEVAA